MNKLLHIVASPREEDSRTLKLTRAFMDSFVPAHPGWVVEELNLFAGEIPSLALRRVDGRYVLLDGRDLFGRLKEAWQEIIYEIERFKSADAYLISAPMWNFSIPYVLKQYIDVIVQPNYTFRYVHGEGVEGLVTGRKMMVITSRGGEYTDPESRAYDFQEPYLRTIMGFIGITDIRFIIAQPMDLMGPDIARQRLEEALALAREQGAVFP